MDGRHVSVMVRFAQRGQGSRFRGARRRVGITTVPFVRLPMFQGGSSIVKSVSVLGISLAFIVMAACSENPAESSAVDAEAGNDLGLASRLAETVSEMSFSELQERAEAGDPESLHILGTLYENGEGVERDMERAADLFRQAADQGLAASKFRYGLMLLDGRGVERDDELGRAQLEAAQNDGFPAAAYVLGNIYREGRGVDVDEERAAELYLQGAMVGHPPSQMNYAVMLAAGLGVEEPDVIQAYVWASLAEQGNVPRAGQLRETLGQALDEEALTYAHEFLESMRQ